MKSRTLEVIVLVLSAIFLAGLGYAVWEFIVLERTTTASTAALTETLTLTNQALKGKQANGHDGLLFLARILLQNADSAANALKQTAQDANAIAKEQKDKTGALTDSSIALVRSGNDAIVKRGGAIDGLNAVIGDVRSGTLPRLNAGVDDLNGLVGDLRPTAKASTDLVNQGAEALQGVNVAVGRMNSLLADPSLAAIAGHLDDMSINLDAGAGHANRALGYVEMDLSPKHLPLWQSILEMALSQAVGIPLKWLPQNVQVVNSSAK